MYQQPPAPDGVPVEAPRFGRWPRVPANVWALGLTSLLTDVSSEMVTSILPLYVVLHLQMTPLAYGATDALYQGAAALVRTASGVVADRLKQHKLVAACGYALSAIAKLGYLVAGGWGATFLAVISVDRFGKGIRTAPRDALVAASARPGEAATAFGVHRAMDAAGAALGPLTAFAVLALAPGRYDQVFVVSLAAAVVGVAALLLLVDTRPAGNTAVIQRARGGQIGAALGTPVFQRVLVAACVLSVASVSDGLLYLVLQRRHEFAAMRLPLLFVGTPLCYFLLAGPCGIVADRHGTRRLFLAGHVALAAVYAVLWQVDDATVAIGGALLLLGAYYAATDGILAAMASTVLPADARATGLGVLATATTAGRGLAALAFGALWTSSGTAVALPLFATGLGTAIVAGTWLLRGVDPLRRSGAQP